jgi:hypothetical protein
MGQVPRWIEAAVPSHSAAYDIVLLAHVLAVLASLVAVVVAGGSAVALSRPGPVPQQLLRYYRPGANWAGRVLFVVPVLGFILITLSEGQWAIGDRWIVIGLVLWLAAATLAEAVLWPTERRLQEAVARMAAPVSGPSQMDVPEPSGVERTEPFRPHELSALCRRVTAVAGVVTAILVGASVVMVAKP